MGFRIFYKKYFIVHTKAPYSGQNKIELVYSFAPFTYYTMLISCSMYVCFHRKTVRRCELWRWLSHRASSRSRRKRSLTTRALSDFRLETEQNPMGLTKDSPRESKVEPWLDTRKSERSVKYTLGPTFCVNFESELRNMIMITTLPPHHKRATTTWALSYFVGTRTRAFLSRSESARIPEAIVRFGLFVVL